MELEQVTEAVLGSWPQTLPQPPQFWPLVVVEVSQPLVDMLSQSSNPCTHVEAHWAAMQLTMVFGAFLHAISHELQ